jgi:hypothetical protein
MLEPLRPDVTTEGWNTWPTEKVSHALVRDPRTCAIVKREAAKALRSVPPDVAAYSLAPTIRRIVDGAMRTGEAEDLRDNLLTFALSRVDWLQLARAEIEAATPEEAEPCSRPNVVSVS